MSAISWCNKKVMVRCRKPVCPAPCPLPPSTSTHHTLSLSFSLSPWLTDPFQRLSQGNHRPCPCDGHCPRDIGPSPRVNIFIHYSVITVWSIWHLVDHFILLLIINLALWGFLNVCALGHTYISRSFVFLQLYL